MFICACLAKIIATVLPNVIFHHQFAMSIKNKLHTYCCIAILIILKCIFINLNYKRFQSFCIIMYVAM